MLCFKRQILILLIFLTKWTYDTVSLHSLILFLYLIIARQADRNT